MTTLAIDIGGTKLAAALVDTQHRVLEKQTLSTPASKTPRNYAALSVKPVLRNQIENDDPQPHVVVAFGFLITKREPSRPS